VPLCRCATEHIGRTPAGDEASGAGWTSTAGRAMTETASPPDALKEVIGGAQPPPQDLASCGVRNLTTTPLESKGQPENCARRGRAVIDIAQETVGRGQDAVEKHVLHFDN
jgi:hypothetical protein